MKVKLVRWTSEYYSPSDCDLTIGKIYNVINDGTFVDGVRVVDDIGDGCSIFHGEFEVIDVESE